MRHHESTSGKAHTTDEDYAKFSGQLVMTVSTTYYDPKRKAWIKRTCEYIDLGRADAVSPCDVVDELEPVAFDYKPNTDAASRANKVRNAERFSDLLMDVTAYLRQNGPSHMACMAHDLEKAKATLDEFVRKREGAIFCKVGNVGRAVLWGLTGIHDKAA